MGKELHKFTKESLFQDQLSLKLLSLSNGNSSVYLLCLMEIILNNLLNGIFLCDTQTFLGIP